MNNMLTSKKISGGSFLVQETIEGNWFTPEDLTEEHLMMAEMTEKFVMNDVMPVLDKIEDQEFEYTVSLLKKAGELGLLGLDVPEEYGGLDLDKISSTVITEKIGLSRSFCISYSGQVGIGSLPIVYFGTKQQKDKYLPQIVSAEKIGAYALTEPSSGTDALGAKTTARLSDCGNYYILTGEKQWITNSAFADLFIVFAKIDGKDFTAFIVEKEYEGLTTGPEEKKMGLKGSSTRSLILDHVKVPVENVLGEIGKGHVIAFNILNIGRHKISAQCLGTSKRAIELSVKYGKDRKQFGQSLTDFSLIKEKIADMSILTYVNESMVYRTAGLIDQGFELEGNTAGAAEIIGEYAVECSINKVFSTESYDSIIDEAVQIHGGYGYMAEYEVETLYRDSRINRIFEGTNEINRMVIASTLLKKLCLEDFEDAELQKNHPLSNEISKLQKVKKVFKGLTANLQCGTLDKNKDQEILAALSDLVIAIYAMDSAILRTYKAIMKNGIEREELKLNITKVYVQETALKSLAKVLQVAAYLGNNDLKALVQDSLNDLINNSTVDVITIKRSIAEEMIQNEGYTSTLH